MRCNPIRLALLALLAVAWIAPSVIGPDQLRAQDDAAKKQKQEKKKKGKKKKQQLPPEVEAMLALAAPGEEHKILQRLVGKWNVVTKSWMGPGATPVEGKASSSTRLVLGGRFAQQDYRGSFMGIKFQGLGLTGYDKQKKKYVNVWLDSGSTMIAPSEGAINDEGNAVTFHSKFPDPQSGQTTRMKIVMRFESADRYVMDFFRLGEGGKEHQQMQLAYTRRVAKKKAPKAKKPAAKKPAAKAEAKKKSAAKAEAKKKPAE